MDDTKHALYISIHNIHVKRGMESVRKTLRYKKKWTKLNYRFHNSNSVKNTADFLCKLMIEGNAGKVEHTIEKAMLYAENGEYIPEVLAEVQERICV